MTNDTDKQSFGQAGYTYTDDTSPVAGNYCLIDVLEDTVFSALSIDKGSGTALTSRSWKRGDKIFGFIKGYTLTSGEVIAYKSA